jgi:hypothetical protein
MEKAADYAVARLRVRRVALPVGAAVLALWTIGGALDLLDRACGGRGRSRRGGPSSWNADSGSIARRRASSPSIS